MFNLVLGIQMIEKVILVHTATNDILCVPKIRICMYRIMGNFKSQNFQNVSGQKIQNNIFKKRRRNVVSSH